MIRTFRSKPLRQFFETDKGSKLPVQNHARVARILNALDDAQEPTDMDVAGNYFHQIHGNPLRYSVRVSGNSRITWTWNRGALDVDIEDYH